MRIVVHVSGYYDWEPLPDGVEVTDADIKARRVKPATSGTGGGWLMRVAKKGETHTEVCLPEEELIALLLQDAIRERQIQTRSEGVAKYLARHVMPHHAHRTWMDDFEVQDDGSNEAHFAKLIDEHVAAGTLEPEDKDAMLAAYREPVQAGHHEAHLQNHFGAKKRAEKRRAKMAARAKEA